MTATQPAAEIVDERPGAPVRARFVPTATSGPANAFLIEQVRRLAPLDFVMVSGPELPAAGFELVREEAGGLRIRLLPVDPAALTELQRGALEHLGLHPVVERKAGTAWERSVLPGEAETAVAVVDRILGEVFGASLEGALDVHHGSHRAEFEAARKLEELRGRIEPILTELLGSPPTLDPDGDWVFPYESTQVFVAPRVTADAMVVVRVFAITNVGLSITPQLALFIASLNFGLAFCRFALDVQHGAVWVDETLLGDLVSDEELRFTVKTVASTASEWQSRIKETFGGITATDLLTGRAEGAVPNAKPGHGGYL